MTGRASTSRTRWPWKPMGVICLIWFAGLLAASYFARAGEWFFLGLGMGSLAMVYLVGWDERERRRAARDA